MGKEWILILCCLSVLCACNKTKHIVHEDPWIDYRKAYNLSLKHSDSVFYYYNQSATRSKDSTVISMAYCNMGILQSIAGDYYGAQESLSASLKFLNDTHLKDHDMLSRVYNELGLSVSALKEYTKAITYYDKALKFTNDSNMLTPIFNNKANSYRHTHLYKQALTFYQKAITHPADQQDYARMLANMTVTKWLNNPYYNAAPDLLKSLKIRKKENDLSGQCDSYDYLTQYNIRPHPDAALIYAREMYNISTKLNEPATKIKALQWLIKLEPTSATRGYFDIYQQVSDSIQTARNAAKNQFALIRYNVEKSKADNLKLQKDISEERYKAIRQRLLLYSIFLLLVGAITAIVFWYKKRTERLKMEARSAIRDSEMKTSKKVHDVVANGLYRIMAELEHKEIIDKTELLDQVEELYDRSRDISYEKIAITEYEFHKKITKLLTVFATSSVRVLIVGNGNLLWETISSTIKKEIEYVLQELMVNMKKHSHASQVVLKFDETDGQLNIYYTDNGVGLPDGMKYGNGLTNVRNRIISKRGSVIFNNESGKGLKLHITFPIRSFI